MKLREPGSLFDAGIHFRKRFGDQIMAAVRGDTTGVGAELNGESVEVYLAQVENLRHTFEVLNEKSTEAWRHAVSPQLGRGLDSEE